MASGGDLPTASEIEVRKFKDIDLTEGSIVEAIPTVGFLSPIASSYIIQSLELDQIAALESPAFPPVSMIYARKPKFPARVYAREDLKLAIFISEIPMHPGLHRPMAQTLLDWTRDQAGREIICLEGLPVPEGKTEPGVWGVGSTERARGRLEESGIDQLEIGMIPGISGVLLNEGRWVKLDVISLVTETQPAIPDALAAARLVEAVDKLLPQVEIPIDPLVEQAERIQEHLAAVQEQARPAMEPALDIYR
ncbi:MAG: proteasome assembly chaperone family protein [Thermoplasmata archaeon]